MVSLPYEDEIIRIGNKVTVLIPPRFRELLPDNAVVEQLLAITVLPQVHSIVCMPDIHLGYAFPIGSVVCASIVVPEGVGSDINCGIRMLRTRTDHRDVDISALARRLFETVPSGMGAERTSGAVDRLLTAINRERIGSDVFNEIRLINGICDEGMDFLVQHGLVTDDRDRIEQQGRMPGCSRMVSQRAKAKGIKQLGSLGAGNHFLEIQRVAEVFDETAGFAVDELVVMIHTGSRGLGHEVCTDAIRDAGNRHNYSREEVEQALANECIVSQETTLGSTSADASASTRLSYFEGSESEGYLLKMGSAANYAFCNRAIISDMVSSVLGEMDIGCELVYDVGHNSLHVETVDGQQRYVHRKGAALALPPHHPDLRSNRSHGQPIPIGGSMGTASYLLYAQNSGLSMHSSPHGAGRVLSRRAAREQITPEHLCNAMGNTILLCRNPDGAVEEAPMAYKDIEAVVDAAVALDIVKKAVRLEPLAVIKG